MPKKITPSDDWGPPLDRSKLPTLTAAQWRAHKDPKPLAHEFNLKLSEWRKFTVSERGYVLDGDARPDEETVEALVRAIQERRLDPDAGIGVGGRAW